MLQQLVDNRIMSIEGSTATPPVVRITEFPNAAYEEDGFWSQVGGKVVLRRRRRYYYYFFFVHTCLEEMHSARTS